MTKYAFVIDQRKCIGCHACTVACKAEHDVRKAHEVYKHWFGMTRPQTNRPAVSAFKM